MLITKFEKSQKKLFGEPQCLPKVPSSMCVVVAPGVKGLTLLILISLLLLQPNYLVVLIIAPTIRARRSVRRWLCGCRQSIGGGMLSWHAVTIHVAEVSEPNHSQKFLQMHMAKLGPKKSVELFGHVTDMSNKEVQ